MSLRECRKCGKPLRSDNTMGVCGRTACRAEYIAAWQRARPDRVREIKAKHNEKRRRLQHGLRPGMFEQFLAAQKGVCFICRTPFREDGKDAFVDHDHSTGLVRGLLCSRCNIALGGFRDDVRLLRHAILYLTCGKAA